MPKGAQVFCEQVVSMQAACETAADQGAVNCTHYRNQQRAQKHMLERAAGTSHSLWRWAGRLAGAGGSVPPRSARSHSEELELPRTQLPIANPVFRENVTLTHGGSASSRFSAGRFYNEDAEGLV